MSPRPPAALLALLILAASAAGCRREAEAPPPEAAVAVRPAPVMQVECPIPTPVRTLRIESAEDHLVLDPDPGLGPAAEVWRGDLNSDGLEDLLLRFPSACGNWGECPYAALAGCEGERFVEVLEADYAVGLEVAEKSSSDGWRDLLRSERTGAAESRVRTLRFGGRQYAAAD